MAQQIGSLAQILMILAAGPQAGEIESQTVAAGYFATRADEYMQARVRVSGFSGAVLVARAGQVLFRGAYGLANRTFDVPNTPQTRFRLGSVTKPFTAAAILLLESRGKLGIDDPVSQYMPTWPDAWAAVTVRHLLTHATGLPRLTIAWPLLDVSGLTRSVLTQRPASVLDLASEAERSQPLDFEPGHGFAYSNIGYVLLGEIIERVSGKPYAVFMDEELFRPLGMTNTGAEDPQAIEPHLATGYVRTDTQVVEAGYVDLRLVGGAGVLYSTVDDLLRWDLALSAGHLFPATLQERMFSQGRFDYAMGWWVQRQFGRSMQWHRGNIQGFVSIMVRYPEDSLFVAVASNVEGTQVLAMANELTAMAFGLPYELPRQRQVAALSLERFDPFTGRYANTANAEDTFVFRRDGERLFIESPTPGAWSFEVFAESPTRIFARAIEWDAIFILDDQGQVDELRTRNQGVELLFRPSR